MPAKTLLSRRAGFTFVEVNDDDVTFEGRAKLTTYVSSELAERQHCSRCGATVTWRRTRGRAGKIELSYALLVDKTPIRDAL
jgi:hypothetical protein